jgi:hypothetical protein
MPLRKDTQSYGRELRKTRTSVIPHVNSQQRQVLANKPPDIGILLALCTDWQMRCCCEGTNIRTDRCCCTQRLHEDKEDSSTANGKKGKQKNSTVSALTHSHRHHRHHPHSSPLGICLESTDSYRRYRRPHRRRNQRWPRETVCWKM